MTYEYACEACGHQWEAEQSIKDAPLKSCASCGEPKAKRLISGGTGFLLKGGGWYADGYGGKAAAPIASSGEPAAKGPSEGAGGGADSGTKSEGTAKNEPKSPSPAESTASKPADAPPKPSSAPSTPSAKAS
ncbi:MAG: FmdB family zinc ribbon protein [Deltaproteobacteria bacterium]